MTLHLFGGRFLSFLHSHPDDSPQGKTGNSGWAWYTAGAKEELRFLPIWRVLHHSSAPLSPAPPPGQIRPLLTLSIGPWEAWARDDSAWAAVARWAQALAGSLGTTQPRTHSQNRPRTGWEEGWGRGALHPHGPSPHVHSAPRKRRRGRGCMRTGDQSGSGYSAAPTSC